MCNSMLESRGACARAPRPEPNCQNGGSVVKASRVGENDEEKAKRTKKG